MKKQLAAILFALLLLTGSAAASFTYKDPDTGTTFTVPSGFTQKELYKERQTISVKFVYDKDGVSVIMFGAVDLWGLLEEQSANTCSRDEFNMSMPEADEFIEEIGDTYESAEAVTVNGVKYYKATSSSTSTVLGQTYAFQIFYYVTIDYGYAYIYQLHSLDGAVSDEVMIGILKTADYPEHADAAESSGNPSPQAATTKPTAKPTAKAAASVTAKPSATVQTADSGNSTGSVSILSIVKMLLALLLTVAAYGAVPMLMANCRTEEINVKTYRWVCYGVNFIIALLIQFVKFLGSGSVSSFAFSPYLVWTSVFVPTGIGVLRRRGLLIMNTEADSAPAGSATAVPEQPSIPVALNSSESEVVSNSASVPQTASDSVILPETSDSAEAPSKSAAALDKEPATKFCRYCGKQIPVVSKFCRYCGKSL